MKKRNPYWWAFTLAGAAFGIGALLLVLHLSTAFAPGGTIVSWVPMGILWHPHLPLWLIASIWAVHRTINFVRFRKDPERKPRKRWLVAIIPILAINFSILYYSFLKPDYSCRRNDKAIAKHAVSPAEKENA